MLRLLAAAALLAPVPVAQEVVVDPDAIDAVFANWDRTDSAGCAVGIVHDGELVHARGYGMADLDHGIALASDSVFRIASMSLRSIT